MASELHGLSQPAYNSPESDGGLIGVPVGGFTIVHATPPNQQTSFDLIYAWITNTSATNVTIAGYFYNFYTSQYNQFLGNTLIVAHSIFNLSAGIHLRNGQKLAISTDQTAANIYMYGYVVRTSVS